MESEKQRKIRDLLTEMRDPKGEKSIFKDYLSEAWELLGLDGKESLLSLEVLLIEAVINITIHKKKKMSADEYKKAAQKCDAYLLALGLLDGYYHTNEDRTPYAAADRHKDYLSKSDYMELVRPTFKSTDNINIEDAESKPRRNISQDDTRCRKYLGRYLSKTNNCQKCIEDGIKVHTEIIRPLDKREHMKRVIKLPKPCFTLKNFPLPTEQDDSSSPDSLSVKDELDDDVSIIDIEESENEKVQESEGGVETRPINSNPPEPSPPETGWLNTIISRFKMKLVTIRQSLTSVSFRLPKASSIALVISVSALAIIGVKWASIIEDRNVTAKKETSEALEDAKKIALNKIEIVNKYIELSLGEDDYLIVKTEPSELNPNDLFYVSSNPDAAYMENIHSGHVTAVKELADDVRSYSEVVVHDGSNAQDTAIILIKEPGQNESARNGKTDNGVSSGNFQEK